MRILTIAVTFALAAGAASAAKAGDGANRFAVEGPGGLNCSKFLEARADKASAQYQRMIGFVEGYLGAANRYEPNTFDLAPWHNAAAFDLILEKHCTANPDEPIMAVVQKMVSALRPLRVAEYSKLVEVGDGTNKAIVYEAILRRAQAALRTRGLYDGAEDGAYSAKMRQSLLAFQKTNKLYETGVPDPATLWTLLNP